MTSPTEASAIASRRGKWSMPGVPHRGWTCLEIEDLGEPSQTCEMCESSEIRYAHHMSHPEYAGELVVGCICAGHLEGSLVAAEAREAKARNRASKKTRWLTRKWKISAKGNATLKADGFRVTVYPRGGGWGATLAPVEGGTVHHARRNYPTPDAAKLAAFDAITTLIRPETGP